MEKAYKADGWLGFIIGAKLFYDFSGKYPFEKKMTELINEVQSSLQTMKGVTIQVPNAEVQVQVIVSLFSFRRVWMKGSSILFSLIFYIICLYSLFILPIVLNSLYLRTILFSILFFFHFSPHFGILCPFIIHILPNILYSVNRIQTL